MSELVLADRFIPDAYQGKLEPNYFCRAWNGKRDKYCRARAGSGTNHPGVGRCKHHEGRPLEHGRYARLAHQRLGPLLEEFRSQTPEESLNIFPELALARALLYDWVDRFETFAEALVAWHRSHEERSRPIATDKVLLLEELLDELEDLLNGSGSVPSDRQLERLEQARRFVDLLGSPNPNEKPRKILDITTLNALLDTVSKMIHRWHQAASINSIPRRRFFDIMGEIGRAMNEEVSSPAELQRLQARLREIRL